MRNPKCNSCLSGARGEVHLQILNAETMAIFNDSKPVYKKKFHKLKRDLITVKTTQIFTIIKYQKEVLNLFVYK